jgi:hypothetical protein
MTRSTPAIQRPSLEPAEPAGLASPQLPPWPLVWFAVEGEPGAGQETCAIHLWGLALDDGKQEPEPEAIVADFEDAGGQRAWERFVARAGEILERWPQARWVHGSPREKAGVRRCAAIYGAPEGFVERLEEALFDLHRGLGRGAALPSRPRAPGKAARAASRYRRGRASRDPGRRSRLLREITDDNAGDLLAMRAVWRWMLATGPKQHCG